MGTRTYGSSSKHPPSSCHVSWFCNKPSIIKCEKVANIIPEAAFKDPHKFLHQKKKDPHKFTKHKDKKDELHTSILWKRFTFADCFSPSITGSNWGFLSFSSKRIRKFSDNRITKSSKDPIQIKPINTPMFKSHFFYLFPPWTPKPKSDSHLNSNKTSSNPSNPYFL